MIRVTYLSRSAEPLSADALLTLLSQCHRNNTARGLTGMLLFGNGTFLQSIEGDEVAVDALLDRIAVDPRHTALKILRRETITNRQFADWSMGFERVTDVTLAGTPGLRDFRLRNFNPEFLATSEITVESLLDRHRSAHWDPLVRELDAREKLIADLRGELAHARNDTQMAALVLETVVEVAVDGRLDEAHLELCRTTLRSLR
jgi:hypothetical protein